MNTTATTANDQQQRLATFAPNAIYSVPTLGIQFEIEFNSDRTSARILDGNFVTEFMEIVNNGGYGFIDPNGYMLPLSDCQEIAPAHGLRNTLLSFRHQNADAPGFSGIKSTTHAAPGWRAAVIRLKQVCPDEWQNFAAVGVSSRYPVVIRDSVYKLQAGIFWPVDMPDAVIDILAPCASDRSTRFIFDFGDIETGRSWNEENDISGYIGRSSGQVKIPILIHSSRSHGGGALSGSIVRVLTSKGKRVLYQHPTYHSTNV